MAKEQVLVPITALSKFLPQISVVGYPPFREQLLVNATALQSSLALTRTDLPLAVSFVRQVPRVNINPGGTKFSQALTRNARMDTEKESRLHLIKSTAAKDGLILTLPYQDEYVKTIDSTALVASKLLSRALQQLPIENYHLLAGLDQNVAIEDVWWKIIAVLVPLFGSLVNVITPPESGAGGIVPYLMLYLYPLMLVNALLLAEKLTNQRPFDKFTDAFRENPARFFFPDTFIRIAIIPSLLYGLNRLTTPKLITSKSRK